jgi:hypothetical protein
VEAHAIAPIPSARAKRPHVPEQLDLIVQRLLSKIPSGRYAIPAEVEEALRPFDTVTPVTKSAPDSNLYPKKLGPGLHGKWILVACCLLVLLLLGVVSLWKFLKCKGRESPSQAPQTFPRQELLERSTRLCAAPLFLVHML